MLDELGEPVVGASRLCSGTHGGLGGPIMQQTASTMTDDRGMYHVDVVPGDYIVGLLAATTTVPATAVDGFLQAIAAGRTGTTTTCRT